MNAKNLKLYLAVLMLVLASAGIVSAADSAARDWRFSSASNAQFYRAGTSTSFSQQNAAIYWPILADSDKCEATTDFMMFIQPGGCSPSIVRSDLLEEQNVPVFCKVDIIKLNPLIDVSRLKSVKFTGDYGEDKKYIAGVSFHPNKEAIYSQKEFLDNPLINDVGYVVVLLKKIEAEKDMPKSIKINLTGVLKYDSEGIFGSGQSAFYLDEIVDDDWARNENYKENSFFKGRGYLRAESIDDAGARISIYRDAQDRIGSVTLKKGETSSVQYIPGFYCRAGVKIKLEDLAGNIKKAQLEVNDNLVWVTEGEKFLDNKCRVVKIDVQEKRNSSGAVIQSEKSVRVTCNGKSKTLSYNETGTGDKLEDRQIDENARIYFDRVRENAEDLEASYGGLAVNGDVYAAKAFYLLGGLAKKLGLYGTSRELYNRVISDYSDTPYATSAETALSGFDKSGTIEGSIGSNYIRLVQVRHPNAEDASVDLTIKTGSSSEKITGLQEKQTRSKITILKLYSDKVYLEYTPASSAERVDSRKFYMSYDDRTASKGNSIIELDEIHFKQTAKVSLISEMKNDYSQADFTFEVGIEKRLIQLSPDKARERIAELNKTIADWEKITKTLGNVVTGMKGACLATSAVLVVKNFFSNLKGGATARQAVMPVWYQRCQRESGNDKNAFNACLKNHGAEIEKDVATYSGRIESVNTELLNIQNANKIAGTETVDRTAAKNAYRATLPNSVSYTRYETLDAEAGTYKTTPETIPASDLDKASITDLRDLKLYSGIAQDSSTSESAKQNANMKISAIASRLSKKQLDKDLYTQEDTALSWANKIKVSFFGSGTEKGMPETIPIPKSYTLADGKKASGFYVLAEANKDGKGGSYTSAGDVKNFWIQNIGSDGLLDRVDDPKYYVDMNIYKAGEAQVLGLNKQDSKKIVEDSIQLIKTASRNYGQRKINLGDGFEAAVDMAQASETRCQDFMSPEDCYMLFNVCDPVVCPSSRCDLGGAYRVDNVVQSGIIGSIALCLPNLKEGIFIPVCLSGIYAGLESYVSILRSYRDCLQESVDSGKTVGICDEIHSIYICEFFWRQIGPFMDMIVMKLIESAYGQGMKGGGEYLTVQDAWKQASNTVDYMKNDYASNSYQAFNLRSTNDIGSEFCKLFVSARFPGSADFLDNLLTPDNPSQFYAWYDEIAYSDATVPATSQYKVYYHIYAGTDIGTSYQVYLKNPPSSAYVSVQDRVIVDTGYINKGGYASQARDFTAPSGYKELCVRINGKDECGFKKVSSSFAINSVSDLYYQEQLKSAIRTKDECISGTASAYSLLNPNVQEGAAGALSPSLNKQGVVRVCSTTNPGKTTNPSRWVDSGYCDDESVRCWLDKESAENVIKNKNIENETISSLTSSGVSGLINAPLKDIEYASNLLNELKKTKDTLDKILKSLSTKTTAERTAQIYAYLKTDETGVAINNINLQDIANKAEEVESSEVSNSMKAEASYYKFIIYYNLVDALANANLVMTEIATEGDLTDYYTAIEKEQTEITAKAEAAKIALEQEAFKSAKEIIMLSYSYHFSEDTPSQIMTNAYAYAGGVGWYDYDSSSRKFVATTTLKGMNYNDGAAQIIEDYNTHAIIDKEGRIDVARFEVMHKYNGVTTNVFSDDSMSALSADDVLAEVASATEGSVSEMTDETPQTEFIIKKITDGRYDLLFNRESTKLYLSLVTRTSNYNLIYDVGGAGMDVGNYIAGKTIIINEGALSKVTDEDVQMYLAALNGASVDFDTKEITLDSAKALTIPGVPELTTRAEASTSSEVKFKITLNDGAEFAQFKFNEVWYVYLASSNTWQLCSETLDNELYGVSYSQGVQKFVFDNFFPTETTLTVIIKGKTHSWNVRRGNSEADNTALNEIYNFVKSNEGIATSSSSAYPDYIIVNKKVYIIKDNIIAATGFAIKKETHIGYDSYYVVVSTTQEKVAEISDSSKGLQRIGTKLPAFLQSNVFSYDGTDGGLVNRYSEGYAIVDDYIYSLSINGAAKTAFYISGTNIKENVAWATDPAIGDLLETLETGTASVSQWDEGKIIDPDRKLTNPDATSSLLYRYNPSMKLGMIYSE